MHAAAAAIETIHNAHAAMPGACGEDEDYTHYQSQLAQGIKSICEQALCGLHTHTDLGTIDAILNLIAHPNRIDDCKLLVKPVHPTAFSVYPDPFIPKARKGSLPNGQLTRRLLQPMAQEQGGHAPLQ